MPTERIQGQRLRTRQALEILRHHVAALESLVLSGDSTSSVRQAMTSTAVRAGELAAVLEALTVAHEESSDGQ